MKRWRFKLTTQIVMLVAIMGGVSALLTAYSAWHMQRIETQYHSLLKRQALAANTVGSVREALGDASSLAHSVLTARSEETMLEAQRAMYELQAHFEDQLARLYPLLPGNDFELDRVLTQSRHAFAAAHRAIAATLRWRGDRALQVLAEIYHPAYEKLRVDLDALRFVTQQSFEQESFAMASATQRTLITTTLAGWLTALCIAALSARFAMRHLAQPLVRMTQRMRKMSAGDYQSPVEILQRDDELGWISQALQGFAHSLRNNASMQQELALQQRNQLLMDQLVRLTSAIPGAVFQIRFDAPQTLALQFVSPQWAALMGCPDPVPQDSSAIGRMLAQLDAHVTSVAVQHFQRSAATQEPLDFDVCITMMDGVQRWVKTRANPFREADGSVLFHGVWTDVSKEIVQARALEKAKRQAEQNANEKSILQASISHEIRTPLNAILGLTQLLLKADIPEAHREQIRHVLRASQHLRGIVNEVLDFSKIDAGQVQLESTDFDLRDVLDDVVGMCREEAQLKGLHLGYSVAPEVPLALRGDPHRIAQILLNYVNNAIKFTSRGSVHIALRLEPSSTLHCVHLHVSVQDSGPGIPADRLPLVFEPFQQADNSITRRFGGTGLGLTISKALAQLMGGDAGVQSQLGQGSRFWFTAKLEPARSSVSRQAQSSDSSAALPWTGRRALVVDDHPINRTVAQGLLQSMGLQVQTCEDGVQALEVLQAHGTGHFDCVLMDVQMPHMDGMSATRALRQLAGFEQLPVIAMTAHTGLQDIARCHAAGMNAHLAKPLLESALQAVLQQILRAPLNVAGNHPSASGAPRIDSDAPSHALPGFDQRAIADLLQVFDAPQVRSLMDQFCQDTEARVQMLQSYAQAQDWAGMRAEAHKLSGTAATFGLVQLGERSQALSAALKQPDALSCDRLTHDLAESARQGIAQLRAYDLTASVSHQP
ncbi:MAG: response regulator [Comamonas sp.]